MKVKCKSKPDISPKVSYLNQMKHFGFPHATNRPNSLVGIHSHPVPNAKKKLGNKVVGRAKYHSEINI